MLPALVGKLWVRQWGAPRGPGAAKARFIRKEGTMTLSPQRNMQLAAGDPRLAGVKSLRVRTAVVGSDGKVDLIHSIAGAQYAFGFSQTITRCQLVAVWSPISGRSYLGNVAELSCASLLGTGKGLDARGTLEVAGADLQPFEVAWDDATALRGHVLSRLLDVNMQCQLRSIVSALSTVAYRLAPALLASAGLKRPGKKCTRRCAAEVRHRPAPPVQTKPNDPQSRNQAHDNQDDGKRPFGEVHPTIPFRE
ncbi:hypothetical protein D9Q98_010387 [Chlorella vulgaris]|uniref:Uncharacterized protein n=1 Tax=Chlorella vulgaris TaxID=3077 RepID=A0A9D4YY07_CHLVU|nr:hypothetical protein D9Q98_010387 [Chlorella vulgaris]